MRRPKKNVKMIGEKTRSIVFNELQHNEKTAHLCRDYSV